MPTAAPSRPLLAALLCTALLATPALAPAALAQPRPSSSGSGFMVGDTQALTNRHVVAGCQRLEVRNARGQTASATVLAEDAGRDLALLRLPPGAGTPLVFRDGPPVERGEAVVTYGFPLHGLLSSGPTLTTGTVSALSGIRDNPLHLQISAPVQPGNSGGPVLDSHGHVIGVVVAKLDALRISRLTGGDVPQNVNFAIKGPEAAAFLAAHGAAPRLAASTGPELAAARIGEIANPATLFVACYGGARPPAPPPVASVANAAGKPANDPSFRLVNRDTRAIAELFATPAGSGNWGRNRLDRGALPPGEAHLFQLPRGACRYDLRVVFAGGQARERRGVDLCAVRDLPVP